MSSSKTLVFAAGLLAAAATLSAQRQMTAAEASAQFDRANRSFADARYEDAYKQFNDAFSAARAASPRPP